MQVAVILIAVACFAMPAFAHHSDAALDMNVEVSFEGRVVEYSLRNPHAYFTVEAQGTDGAPVQWNVQMASSITMRRLGWTADSLALGESVRVSVRPARDGRPYGLLNSITKANGEALVSSPSRAAQPVVAEKAATVFGRWLVDRSQLPADYLGGLDQLMIRELALTEKGQLASDAYSQDSDENPELSCISKPTPAMIIYTDLYPLELTLNDTEQTITVRSQYFDQSRTVYMDGRSHPAATELFHEGHSIGSWEGDALVIDTTNFAIHRSPYQNGIPSGPAKHVVERFALTDDGTWMEAGFMLEDPEYIVGTMNYSRKLRYVPDSDMSPFNCDLESTRRFLPR